jgi:hypothetical protein
VPDVVACLLLSACGTHQCFVLLHFFRAPGNPMYEDPVEGRCCACGTPQEDLEGGKMLKCTACLGVSGSAKKLRRSSSSASSSSICICVPYREARC